MTPKQHFNSIVRKANTINNHLEKIRKECESLINNIQIHADEYDYSDWEYELALLEETLTDLQSFDLEDSIPEKHSNEY